jgi:Na+/H+ antiporter NhaD/arsenite permease-like protein
VSFTEYFVNMAPIAVICMFAALIVNRFQYRKEYRRSTKKVSPVLVEALAADSRIRNRKTLYKALVIAALTFAGFFTADFFDGMPPGVVALSGAALLVAWVRPEMHKMLREVDWTTLLFFIGLFIVVGGLENTGAIEWLATRVAVIAGESVKIAALLTMWVAGIASGIVANIPFTVAALPVADYLTNTIPQAAESGVIYWGLILGADLGGNATILGSAPNIVALGLLGQAGFRLTFGRFVRDALPVTIITMVLASIWLLIRY